MAEMLQQKAAVSLLFSMYYEIKKGTDISQFLKQRYKDSNLEMTESESVALPFGDSAKIKCECYYSI